MTSFDPNHPNTATAWKAVTDNLTERANRGLWGSRSMTVTIARRTGLTYKAADNLIRSAIKHGHLLERPSPLDTGHHKNRTQVTLPGAFK